jgi:hypothetical protein
MDIMHQTDEKLVQKWGPVLEGIDSEYTRRVTAQLLENQAKAIVDEKINEDISSAATTTGRLGTFQKFAFPLVRRVYPSLIANSLVAVQPMQGPVSQVFYLGNSRASGTNEQVVYSKFNMTYRGLKPQRIGSASGTAAQRNVQGGATEIAQGTFLAKDGSQLAVSSAGLDGDEAVYGFDVSNILATASDAGQLLGAGAPSGTMGGQIAAWPNEKSLMGFTLSAGERLTGTGIPEVNFHIEQEAVVANTRKMRTLWTLEASQDLKAYHNLDLERELTDLLSKELALEIDRELIEDIRMIAYGFSGNDGNLGGVDLNRMDSDYINLGSHAGGQFPGTVDSTTTGVFVPKQGTDDFDGATGTNESTELGTATKIGNVFVCDFSQTNLTLYPRHVGEVYANLLATINLASQDIFTTTMRGPGSWLLTSPLVASLLESAAKLEGGIMPQDAPTNMGNNQIQFKGKFMGRYDLYIDPMFPTDEIIVGYKGANAMDAGMVYAPYIPLQQLPTVVDPESFQPRKGLLTRYGKVMIQPHNRFYRVIRIIGPTENYLFTPFAKNNSLFGTGVS